MPLFQFTATDSSGRRQEGLLQADHWQDVERDLFARGWRLTGITEVQQPSAAPTVRSSVPPAPRLAAQPSVAPLSSSRPVQAQLSVGTVKTKWGTDKDLFFLFSQLASYFRSGVNPAVAFENLANSWHRNQFEPALKEAAAASTNGLSVADVLARYPYLFPHHAVGLYRSGEMGGFLPEACEQIAAQAENSHRFRRSYRWLNLVIWSSIASAPVAVWGAKGLAKGFQNLDESGGTGNGGSQIANGLGREFVAILPWCAVLVAASFAGIYLWQSMPNRRLRHRLILRVPTVAKRARNESVAVFAWSLSNLLRAGIAPKTALEVAAGSMPNLALAEQASSAAHSMSAESKLSDFAQRIPMLPPEASSLIQTGEMVGDLPGTMAQVARIEEAEFQQSDKMNRMRVGCWMVLIMVLGSCLMGGLFFRMFYDGIFEQIFKGIE
jgi:type II secretory pathway component PulF